jgi:hypothetical protein
MSTISRARPRSHVKIRQSSSQLEREALSNSELAMLMPLMEFAVMCLLCVLAFNLIQFSFQPNSISMFIIQFQCTSYAVLPLPDVHPASCCKMFTLLFAVSCFSWSLLLLKFSHHFEAIITWGCLACSLVSYQLASQMLMLLVQLRSFFLVAWKWLEMFCACCSGWGSCFASAREVGWKCGYVTLGALLSGTVKRPSIRFEVPLKIQELESSPTSVVYCSFSLTSNKITLLQELV